MAEKTSIIFKPRARLLLQLGDQLIRNESIALLELIKNCYDADATKVDIKMRKVTNPDLGMIIIEDNGMGMDMEIVKNVWMEPGSDYKEKLAEKMLSNKKKIETFARVPLGEKGIGRFAVHKLGNEIELISRKKGCKEIFLQINWKLFGKSKYLGEVPVEIYERSPEVFKKNQTGTRIIIRKLKNVWNKASIREIYRAINSLRSPFKAPDAFDINFDLDKKEWLEGLLSWEQIKSSALYEVECEIEGQYIKKFRYQFTPWPAMKKIESRKITEQDKEIKKVNRMVDKDNKPIDLSVYKIGKVKFEAFIFDRESKVLSLGVQDKKGFKEYLDVNGGIRIYKEGVRVYDYGEPGNDWLSLGIRRVNVPTKRISNNLIIGAIHLTREESTDLIEKTNREGFVENDAYNLLKGAMLYVLNIVETFRNTDKDKIRRFYGPTPVSEPVVSSINDLRNVVEKRIRNSSVKNEVFKYLKRIEDDYKYINEILLRSAGAGLSLSVVIHEIEKIIKELGKIIKKEKVTHKVTAIVKHLSELVEGYSVIVSSTGKKTENLRRIIDQALFNIEFRLKAHNIEMVREYTNFNGNPKIRCARNLITGTIVNIIDNSIWWFDYADTKNKKIYVSISEELPRFLSIVIADNGPGFSLPTEEITKPFVTNKPDGMGLGLHIAMEIMEAHGGELMFPEKGEFSVPDIFRKGAIIALVFSRKEGEKAK